jgi:predicted transposase YdaD
MRSLLEEAAKQGKAARIGAYLDVVSRANQSSTQEVYKMSERFSVFREIMEEAGVTAEWEAKGEVKGEVRGEERKALEIAQNMVNQGYPLETVLSLTNADPEKLKVMY